jgi:hypothetical protein
MLLSFILTYVSASLAVRSNSCCEIKGIDCNDPDYCEILSDMATENLDACARAFHKNGYIPYNMALNERSMTIAQSLVLANENCLKQSFARVNLLIQQIGKKKMFKRMYYKFQKKRKKSCGLNIEGLFGQKAALPLHWLLKMVDITKQLLMFMRPWSD